MKTEIHSRSPSRVRSLKQPATLDDSGTRHIESINKLRPAVNECRRCPLWRMATQGVPGEGPVPAPLMLVGEAPGDVEDTVGHPFAGPAGAVLSKALQEAGIDRKATFVTNAVKHFKFEQRGKRRLHMKPNAGEIKACNWWLSEELKLVRPKLVVALGATAARAILGKTVTISATRGRPTPLTSDVHAMVTIHPSSLLRIPDEAERRTEYFRFVKELKAAHDWLRSRSS
jgi:uracil-DNA glycosylase